jgi:hypothetical protein
MSVGPSAYDEAGASRPRTSEVIAGYLSALAIFTSVIALAWHPLRLSPIAMLLALIGAGMGGKNRRLGFVAVVFSAVCFFLGFTYAVLTQRSLW